MWMREYVKRGGCGAKARRLAVWHASLHGVRRRGDIRSVTNELSLPSKTPQNIIDAPVPFSLDNLVVENNLHRHPLF